MGLWTEFINLEHKKFWGVDIMIIDSQEKILERSKSVLSRDFDFSPIISGSLISNLGNLMNSTKDVLGSNVQKRKDWRDNFMARENELVELINVPCLGDKEKDLLSNTLIKYSKSLLELVYKDLEKIHPRSDNMVMDIVYSFANSSELQVKKSFWLDTIENQNKVLIEVAKASTDPKIQGEACELLVGNCDILISGLKREIEEDPVVFTVKRLQNARETKTNAQHGNLDKNKNNKEAPIMSRVINGKKEMVMGR